ncbi:MAG: hypothetical protein SangKO_026970 [Sandaracinaceae bacterium]
MRATAIDIERLAERLNALRAADPELRVFGAETHRYELRPTLGENDIARFERERGVELPGDYRAFLEQIGDGGAGPQYGLRTLADATRRQDVDLSRDFVWEQRVELDGPASSQVEAWLEDPCGIATICDHGCGYTSFLVVRGPSRGTVWDEWVAADGPLTPTGLDFGSWYLEWIESKLRTIARAPRTEAVRVGMHRSELRALLGEERVWGSAGVEEGETHVGFDDCHGSFLLGSDGRVKRTYIRSFY